MISIENSSVIKIFFILMSIILVFVIFFLDKSQAKSINMMNEMEIESKIKELYGNNKENDEYYNPQYEIEGCKRIEGVVQSVYKGDVYIHSVIYDCSIEGSTRIIFSIAVNGYGKIVKRGKLIVYGGRGFYLRKDIIRTRNFENSESLSIATQEMITNKSSNIDKIFEHRSFARIDEFCCTKFSEKYTIFQGRNFDKGTVFDLMGLNFSSKIPIAICLVFEGDERIVRRILKRTECNIKNKKGNIGE